VKKSSVKKKLETPNLPIVGIGASAGGLEAFSTFYFDVCMFKEQK